MSEQGGPYPPQDPERGRHDRPAVGPGDGLPPGSQRGQQDWHRPAPQDRQQPGQPTATRGLQQPAPPRSGELPAVAPPTSRNRTPIIVTTIVVVVALIAAVGIYLFAIRIDDGTSTAAQSPQDSVRALFTTLSDSDPIGLADRLDPAEAKLFTDLNSDLISELQRLGVLSDAASADSMTGTTISVSDPTFAGDVTINENLRIVQLTGGTITIASDPAKIPLTGKITTAFGDRIDKAQPQAQTVNIADAVAKNGGEPFRVATVRHGTDWYVSLFYTIADNAVHHAGLPSPTKADYIEPIGSASPQAAADALVKQASEGKPEGVIAVLAPDEMDVLHDYGKLLIEQANFGDLTSAMNAGDVSIDTLTWAVSDVTGGKKLSIQTLTLTVDGQSATISRDPTEASVTLTLPNQAPVVLDPDSVESFLTENLGSTSLEPQLLDLIKREFALLIGVGIVTVQVGDNWYVSPVRSFSDVAVSLLKGLQPDDIDYLIKLAQN